ncbi:MAG: peptide-binding protein [Alphaproteobacteria bacterium]|nr:MAG: peptide-binding protein [Alphaproteobacteria bacterium]
MAGAARALAATLLLALAAGPAAADESPPPPLLPELFDVVDVEPGDVLNIREAPSAKSAIIGTLPPDARRIEVVGTDPTHRWGLIDAGGRAGWVSMRYLTPRAGRDPRRFPEHLVCHGTEPFWTLEFGAGGTVALETPEGTPRLYRLSWAEPSANIGLAAWGASFDDASGRASAVIRRGLCSDGMSDRPFGLAIDWIAEDAPGRRLYSGCCSLTR